MQTYQLRLISRCRTIHLFPSLGCNSFTHDGSFEHRFRHMGTGTMEVEFELGVGGEEEYHNLPATWTNTANSSDVFLCAIFNHLSH